jgi:uncharacterized protein (TIGR02300 family)
VWRPRRRVAKRERKIVVKPEWGNKRICQSCGASFYDLRRDPIVCPKCEAVFDLESVLKSRRPRGQAAAPAEKVSSKKVKEEAKATSVKNEVEAETAAEKDPIVAVAGVDGKNPAGDKNADAKDGDDDTVLEDASDLGNDDDVANVIDVEENKEDT